MLRTSVVNNDEDGVYDGDKIKLEMDTSWEFGSINKNSGVGVLFS